MVNIYRSLRRYQPVHWTGIITHSLRWLQAGYIPDYYPNPRFQKIYSESKNKKKLESEAITIIGVHGTADRKSAFSSLVSTIINDLPEEFAGIKLASFDDRAQGKSIEYFADQLVKQIIESGTKNVFFMGHSRGGLVCEIAMQKLKEKGVKVHGLVGIAVPYGGSWLARAPFTFFSNSISEMQPDSPFGQTLRTNIKDDTTPRHLVVGGNDSIVSDEAAAIPEHKKYLKVLKRHSHLSILESERLAAGVLEFLRKTAHELAMKIGKSIPVKGDQSNPKKKFRLKPENIFHDYLFNKNKYNKMRKVKYKQLGCRGNRKRKRKIM